MSAEITLICGVVLFLFGLAISHFHKRSLPSLVLNGVGLGICAWVLLAANVTPVVDDVTYHTIKQAPVAAGAGSWVDYIVVKDIDGKKHFVNINEKMGIKIPKDGRTYKIARVSYKKHTLGLSFKHSAKYQLIAD